MPKRSKNKGRKDEAHGVLVAFAKQQRDIKKRLKTKAGIIRFNSPYLSKLGLDRLVRALLGDN
jgi:hypothetical protein